MTSTAKLLGIYVLLATAYVFLFRGSVLIAAAAAVGATVLTQLIVNYLNPKTPQEEIMQNMGFTGLGLGARPKDKDAEDSAQP